MSTTTEGSRWDRIATALIDETYPLTIDRLAEALKQAFGLGYKQRIEDEEHLKRIRGENGI